MQIQTAQCPKCPAWMILRQTNEMLMSNPPQIRMQWWCNCGHTENGPAQRLSVVQDPAVEWWTAVNRRREDEKASRDRAALPWWRRLLPFFGT